MDYSKINQLGSPHNRQTASQKKWFMTYWVKRHQQLLSQATHFYGQLQQLSRNTRRRVQKLAGVGLTSVAIALAFGAALQPVEAASISVAGACTLEDAITAANTDSAIGNCDPGSGADTITLSGDITLTAQLPLVTSTVTIEGNGHLINADGGGFAVLEVSSATGELTLNNTRITGAANNGSGGGGVAVSDPDAKATISNSVIYDNFANIGGGVFSSGQLTITAGTVISNNQVAFGGGGIYNSGDMTLQDSVVISNSAQVDGGVINFGTALITGTQVINNSGYFEAGGIRNGSRFIPGPAEMTIENSTIDGNSTTYLGGGIYNAGELSINKSTISNNQVTNTDDYCCDYSDGGGIYNNNTGTITITSSTISGNSAGFDGGAIFNNGQLKIYDGSISNNRADDGQIPVDSGSDGGGVFSNGQLGIYGTEITNNYAVDDGGGVYTDNAGISTIISATISGNGSGEDGAGIFNDGTMTLQASTVSTNTAYRSGGGIYGDYQTNMIIRDTVISNNEADIDGGGVALYDGTMSIYDSTIQGNTVKYYDGGGIYNDGGGLNIYRTTISGNTAEIEEGGGIFNAGTLSMTQSTIADNTAGYYGGGIHNHRRTAVIENSTITGNTADKGSGITINNGTLTLRHGTVTSNTTRYANESAFYMIRPASVGNIFGTIIANSNGADCAINAGAFNDNGYNLIEDGTCLTDPSSISGDPKLDILRDNGGNTLTHAPLVGSRALDIIPAGQCTVIVDQTGQGRPIGSACDIGAFETVDDYLRTVTIDITDSAIISYTTPGYTLYQSAEPYTGFTSVDSSGEFTHVNATHAPSYWHVRNRDGVVIDSFAVFPFELRP